MFRKKLLTNDQITVSTLNRTIAHSFFSRYKIKTTTFIGKIKKFYREYRLPSIATSIFIVLLLGLVVVRQLERTSLLALRSEVASGENGYSVLLSTEEDDQFTRGDTAEDPGQESSPTSSTTQSTSSPFNVLTESPTPSVSPSTDSGSSTGSGSGSSGSGSGGGGMVTQPFSAVIDSFPQATVSLQCTNPSKPNKGSCSKSYSFSSSIKTQNGPGTVNYAWTSTNNSGSGNGSINIEQSSTVITTVSRDIIIVCTKESSFTMRFSLISPTSSNSNVLSTNHNCNEL